MEANLSFLSISHVQHEGNRADNFLANLTRFAASDLQPQDPLPLELNAILIADFYGILFEQ